jgi:ferredoxin
MALLNHAKRNENNHLLQQSQYSAQQKAALASIEKEAALKRLKEAESRLREAIQDLHANHANKEDWYRSLFSSTHPLCQHCDSCIANCISSLCQSFLLAYGVRVGVGVLLRAFKLAKNKSYLSILDLKVCFTLFSLYFGRFFCFHLVTGNIFLREYSLLESIFLF